MLEKMIRDALHQSVVYKEQVRLNQAAASALMARLEAQKAICDSAEKQLHRKFKQKEDLEKQIRPDLEQARKRSRIDKTLREDCKALLLCLPAASPAAHKELRKFLQEEQKLSEAQGSCLLIKVTQEGRLKKWLMILMDKSRLKIRLMEMGESRKFNIRLPYVREPEIKEDDDEETRKEKGKGNVEKWLQMLLGDDDTQEMDQLNTESTEEPHKETKVVQFPEPLRPRSVSTPRRSSVSVQQGNEASRFGGGCEKRKSFEANERPEKGAKEKVIARSESARAFRPITSSPSMILGMRKGVDCIRKKPLVVGDEESDQENIPMMEGF